jgi:phage baseplate assembly protein W
MAIIIESKSLDEFLKSTYAIDIDKDMASQVVNQRAISNAIENIVATEYRERIFNPSFGSPLNVLLFENPDEENISQVVLELVKKIEEYEPRVTIVRDQISVNVNVTERSLELEMPYFTTFSTSLETYSTRILF